MKLEKGEEMNKRTIFISWIIILGFVKVVFAGTITGTVSTKKLKVPKDVLVYIEKVEGREFPPSAQPAKMDQVNLVYVPRVLPIVKGSEVTFHNSDDVKHNVFGVGDYDFDLGTWTKGGTKNRLFDKLGEADILCNVHPEMEAYVIVLQNPYFGLTNEQGVYEIKNVPAGSYKLKTWNDKLKPQLKDVLVPESGSVTVDFVF